MKNRITSIEIDYLAAGYLETLLEKKEVIIEHEGTAKERDSILRVFKNKMKAINIEHAEIRIGMNHRIAIAI